MARTTSAKRPSRNPVDSVPADSIEFNRKARMSGVAQPQYLGTTMDVSRIQAALRAAERGDTYLLMTIFRDMSISYTHLGAEWGKRKSVITGQPESLIPNDPNNEDDKVACEVIQEMIYNCRNWFDGLNHLLDATLYPISCAEKIYEPVSASEQGLYKHPLRYRLKEIAPIDYILLNFKVPYLPQFGNNRNSAQVYNADDWESWLRFYATNDIGAVNYSMADTYAPDHAIHIVHRGNMLSSVIPPNFGGHMRSILFWWLLATQDRDWWALMMAKYGMPIPVAMVDAQQKDTVAQIQQALALCSQLGGIVIDRKAKIEWEQVAGTDGSNSHKVFNDYCNCEVSKIVIGQVLSSTPKNTGLGSGMAAQAEEVREDIRQQDSMRLADTLERQLFTQYLRINGYPGKSPRISWGGMRDGAAQSMSVTLANLKNAGLQPTKPALVTIGEKYGFGLEVAPEPKAEPAFGGK